MTNDKKPHLKDGHLRDALQRHIPHMSADVAKESVIAILHALDEGLRTTGKVSLPGFGSFEIVYHKINTKGLRNQRKEADANASNAAPRARLKFKPYRDIVGRINASQTPLSPFAGGIEVSAGLFDRP